MEAANLISRASPGNVSGRSVTVGDFRFNEKAKQYIAEIIASNRLSYGPFHRKLEAQFAKDHDSKYCIFLNSGTSALHIALQALKEKYHWKDGDEVIVPALTFVATVNVVLHCRLTPVLADVDMKTFNVNPDIIEEKITKRTRAIMPVHVMGLPCDMTAIMGIAKRYRLKVVEDSAETMFATHKGKKVGSFGDIGCFSSYMAHFIVSGVGGFCTTSDPDLAERLRSLANHGRDSIYLNIDDDDNGSYETIKRRFRFTSIGHSFRATEFEAAIALSQVEEAQKIVEKRTDNALYLRSHLERYIQPQANHAERTWMTFPFLCDDKERMVKHLEANTIETRDLLPLTTQPCYRGMFKPKDYPVADYINKHGAYLGCHQYLERKELDFVIEKVKDQAKELARLARSPS